MRAFISYCLLIILVLSNSFGSVQMAHAANHAISPAALLENSDIKSHTYEPPVVNTANNSDDSENDHCASMQNINLGIEDHSCCEQTSKSCHTQPCETACCDKHSISCHAILPNLVLLPKSSANKVLNINKSMALWLFIKEPPPPLIS